MSDETNASKASPGPWRWTHGKHGWLVLVRDCTPGEMERRRHANPLSEDTTYQILGTTDVDPADAVLIAAAPTMAEMLRELEWSSRAETDDGVVDECPDCRRLSYEGHAPDCRLAAMLKDLP